MVIATMSVNNNIKKSITQAFDETMQLVVKNAKRILSIDGSLNSNLLKSSLSYDKNEYGLEVIESQAEDGYLVLLTSTTTGKFKNVDFIKIIKNSSWEYLSNVNGVNGQNRIAFKIKNDSSITAIVDSTDDKDIIEEKVIDGCTEVFTEDKYDPSKAPNENIGKIISFCNKDKIYKDWANRLVKGKSEDFYVISDKGDMVTALARYNLMVGSTATDNYAKAYPGLQAKDNLYTAKYPIAFANNNKKKPGCTGDKCYLGYWANDDGSLKDAYKNEEQTNYPCKVFDAN